MDSYNKKQNKTKDLFWKKCIYENVFISSTKSKVRWMAKNKKSPVFKSEKLIYFSISTQVIFGSPFGTRILQNYFALSDCSIISLSQLWVLHGLIPIFVEFEGLKVWKDWQYRRNSYSLWMKTKFVSDWCDGCPDIL